VKNVLLINAALMILFLSETYAGSTHDKRIADATPYPLPAGSQLLQDLGFLAFALPQVEVIMPTKKPRGRALTRAESGQSAHRPSARPHRARQQQREALSHGARDEPPAEGGRPRFGHGSLLCAA
jgi:hypothetical protein